MIEGAPSRMAMLVAMARAAHQLFDAPVVFADPLAVRIIGPDAAAQLTARAGKFQTHFSRELRAFVAARSRFAEDALARAIADGVSQYVILGAGLDTFPYRNPYRDSKLRIFEVDQPATQEWKRSMLATTSIAIPDSTTFVAVDFEHQSLAECLDRAGFARAAPAFFSWLGVTMYLTEDAIASTLGLIASTPPGGRLVFDYFIPPSSLGLVGRMTLALISRGVAASGEPFRTFFAPEMLHARLAGAGFRHVEDLGSDELNARYFRDRRDGLGVRGRLERVVSAEL